MEQLRLKALYPGLRKKRGVSHIDFKSQNSFERFTEKKKMLGTLQGEGFIRIQDGNGPRSRRRPFVDFASFEAAF